METTPSHVKDYLNLKFYENPCISSSNRVMGENEKMQQLLSDLHQNVENVTSCKRLTAIQIL